MTQSLAQAQATVTELVELFHRNLGANKEAEVRHEFVEQFFEALSWDAHNVARYAERYKNVVPERSPHVTAGLEAPSYAVPVGGARRFFVEVNRPTVSLKAAAKPTYELRRYAWSPPLSHCSPTLRSSRSTSAPSARGSPRRQSRSGIWAEPAGMRWRLRRIRVAILHFDDQHLRSGASGPIGDGHGVLPGR